MNALQRFLLGFISGWVIFVGLTLLFAHLNSDCGLPAVLGRVGLASPPCADDIVRVGFPLQFWQEGGIAFRTSFSAPALLFDLLLALADSLLVGFVAAWGPGKLRRKDEIPGQ